MLKIIVIYSLCFLNFCFAKDVFFNTDKSVKFKKSNFGELKDWDKEDYKSALKAFVLSCKKFELMGDNYNLTKQLKKTIRKSDFRKICNVAYGLDETDNYVIKVFFENYFLPFIIIDNKKNTEFGHFTGYYVPEIDVSYRKNKEFKYPIYAKPNNLTYTRKQINDGALKNQGLELLYTNNPIELFFMHIQGSGFGRVAETGEVVAIKFDGKNIHNYSSIVGYMKNRNLIGNDLSAKGIKKSLEENFKILDKILENNKSYIFFKVEKTDSIVGSQGVSLDGLTSLAVDTSLIPLGLPIWLETTITLPDEKIKFHKLMVSQDTGSAIKGAVRGDIFFGIGKEAEEIASYQYAKGRYFILIPKNIAKKLVN